MEARREALALADSLALEREAATLEAEELRAKIELEKERTDVVLEDLAEQRRRADSLAVIAAAQMAEGQADALETGEDLSATLEIAREAAKPPLDEVLDTARVQLAEHLQADRRAALASDELLFRLQETIEATEGEVLIWRTRFSNTEQLLEITEGRCILCEQELAILRDLEDPSFFSELFKKKKTIGIAGAIGLGLGLLIKGG